MDAGEDARVGDAAVDGGDAGVSDAGADSCVTQTFYRDRDDDGYGNNAEPIEACEAPTDYVAKGGDCRDAFAGANPGQDMFFEVPIDTNPANGFDYNCDGTDEKETPHLWGDPIQLCGPTRRPGWTFSVPECGESGSFKFYRATTMDCPVETRTQACR